LLQRFQLLVWPDFTGAWQNIDRAPDPAARARAQAVFDLAATIPAVTPIPTVRFTLDAYALFIAWRGTLEARVRRVSDDAPAYASHIAKFRSLMPALALLVHLTDVFDAQRAEVARLAVAEPYDPAALTTAIGPVPLPAAQRAAALVDFFDAHAQRVYAAELGRETSPRAALAERLRMGAVRDGDPVRDIYRRQWAGLRTRELVEAGLAELVRLDWVRIETYEPPRGRPKRVVGVHPALRLD
jgi:hypothetical protein